MMNNRGNITDGSSVGLPSASTVSSTISPSAVRDFLKENPAFLTENPELLESATTVDGQKTNVVDFAAVQANVFRRRYESLKSNHLSLIRAGRENQGHLDELLSLIHI